MCNTDDGPCKGLKNDRRMGSGPNPSVIPGAYQVEVLPRQKIRSGRGRQRRPGREDRTLFRASASQHAVSGSLRGTEKVVYPYLPFLFYLISRITTTRSGTCSSSSLFHFRLIASLSPPSPTSLLFFPLSLVAVLSFGSTTLAETSLLCSLRLSRISGRKTKPGNIRFLRGL